MSLIFGIDIAQKRRRTVARNICLPESDSVMADYTNIAKYQSWERIAAVTVNLAYNGTVFDGRYIYFAPLQSNSYVPFLRFDTTQTFLTAGAWESINQSTVYGTSATQTVNGCCFDGRYIYYSPVIGAPLLRFDTTQLFTNSGAFEKMSASTAQGASAVNDNFCGTIFDGRYVYYVARNSDTFLRFDTTLSFTNSSAYEKISMSTAQGAAALDNAYIQGGFDGRYIYFCPGVSDTFLRFDNTLSFTNSSAWEKMSASTAQGGSNVDWAYGSSLSYDGRYLYFVPRASATFLRFDTTKSFTNSSAWEKMSMSTAQGGSTVAWGYAGTTFDGRFIYYSPDSSDSFLKFDTTKAFTNSSAWSGISMSTAQGAALLNNAYLDACFDGKYVYFLTYNSYTIVRVLANPSRKPYR